MASVDNAPQTATLGAVTGLSPSVGFPCGHEVQFYFDDRFLIQSLSQYAETALEAGGAVIIVATPAHRVSLAGELGRAGLNLPALSGQSRYVAVDAAETLARFMIDGSPDETRFSELIGDMILCAAASCCGSGKVRIFGEMVALLWQRGEAAAALRLEHLWNELSQSHCFHLRCAYPISSFDRDTHTELFSSICNAHQAVIPAEDISGLSSTDDCLRAIARLQQTQQVSKAEAVERRIAQAQKIEVESQNERLLQEIRRRESIEEELRRFTRRLLTARDEEQRRIAAELHENTAQLLAALSLYFGVLQDEKADLNPRLASVVASSRSVSERLLSEIRKLSHLLHPPTLDDVGLSSALRDYVDQFNRSSGSRVNLEISGSIGRFSRNLEIAVFRIVEEALAGVYPQQDESLAAVRLSRSDSDLIVEIRHQTGMSSSDGAARTKTQIMGIHERVMELGGTVQFTSDRSGSLLAIALPLQTQAGNG